MAMAGDMRREYMVREMVRRGEQHRNAAEAHKVHASVRPCVHGYVYANMSIWCPGVSLVHTENSVVIQFVIRSMNTRHIVRLRA